MRRSLSRLVFVPLAVLFLLEAWLWDHLAPWIAALVRLVPLTAVKAWIYGRVMGLSPTVTLIVFVIPAALLFPLKLVGLWCFGRGYWFLGAATILFAKLIGVGVTAFLFEITRPQLLTLPWFRAIYEWVLRVRAKASVLVAPVRREIRRAMRLLGSRRFGRALRLLRHLRRAPRARYDLRVQKLVSFSPHAYAFTLTGSLTGTAELVDVEFCLRDPQGEVLGAPVSRAPLGAFSRTDELWRTTCFEAFFGEPGNAAYYELNLAPNGRAWNLYRFDAYRAPQPPTPSEDFSLEEFAVGAGTVHARLRARTPMKGFEGNLCAVLLTAQGPEYLSWRHAGAKPDFHLRASFRA